MKDIPDFLDYAVTKDGRVWSKRNKKWLKPQSWGNYLRVTLCRDRKPYQVSLHHVVLETFVGKRPKGMGSRHLDNNTKNNCLSNLKWGTQKENIQDQIKCGMFSGFKKKGRNNPNAKLSEKDVRMIIYMYKTELFKQKEIANIYKVDSSCISNIICKRNWKHIWRN